MRAAIYIRVSTQEQAQLNYSLENQREKARAYCELRGYAIVGEYADPGYSGTTDQRPALAKLLRDAAANMIDVVVVYKLDRFFRSQRHLHTTLHVLESNGVGLASATESFETTTPIGRAMLGMLGTFAQLERDTFMERSSDGTRKAVQQGKYTGGIVAFGYHYNSETRALEIDHDEADIVRRMYQWAAEGLTCYRISEKLNALGVPTKYTREGRGVRGKATANYWRPGRVLNMLKNTAYKGVWQYGRRTRSNQRVLTPGMCPAIVTPELWGMAQSQIASNVTFQKRNRKRDYLLVGLVKCSCGHSYCGSYRARTDGSEYRYYRCTARASKAQIGHSCDNPPIPATFIEDLVWEDVRGFLEDPQNVINALDAASVSQSPAHGYKEELARVRTRLQKVTEAEAKLLPLYTSGALSRDALDREAARLDQERRACRALEREIEQDYSSDQVRQLRMQGIQRQLEELSAHLKDPEPGQVLAVIRALVSRVEVGNDANGQPLVKVAYVFGEPTSLIEGRTGRDSSHRSG